MAEAFFLNALGLTNPLGVGKAQVAENLFKGAQTGMTLRDGLVPDHRFHVGQVDAELPQVPSSLAALDTRNNRLLLKALEEIAPDVAHVVERYGADRIAVVMGTSTSGLSDAEFGIAEKIRTGSFPPEYSYKHQEIGAISEFAARYFGLSGPTLSISTACTSSAKTLSAAIRYMRMGLCDAAIVGGADTLCQMTLSGFHALGSLSSGICNPFSANRDGINIGEGAAVFVLSKEESDVRVMGVGETSDAYHVNAPDPTGAGAASAMRQALSKAQIDGSQVGYVNLHGTATPLNDAMESLAVASVLGENVLCSSTKPMTGHMLGAAGANEIAFMWLSLTSTQHGLKVPPHLWDEESDKELPALNFASMEARCPAAAATMLSNSFAFGGNNISVIIGRA